MAATRFLVTDATDKLGSAVVRHLLDTAGVPADRIVAGARDPAEAKDLAARGVVVRHLDYKDAASVQAAAQGVDRVVVVGVRAPPGQIFPQLQTVVDAVAAAGVQHVLLLSLRGIDNAIPALIADDFRQTEAAVRSSKVQGYTFLRFGPPFEVLRQKIPHVLKSGEWNTATAGGKIAGLSGEDIARAASLAVARAQTADQKVYELTGSEAIGVDEVVSQLNAVLGRSGPNAIKVVHLSTEALAKKISSEANLPEVAAAVLASLDATAAEGHMATVTDHVKQLTGSDPRPFGEWLASHADKIKSL